MKRKLITGLGLALLVFIAGAFIVIKNLDTIVINQRLINEQDVIIGKYNEMLFQLKSAQAELYRHQSGYTKDIDDLVNYIEAFDRNMEFLSGQYAAHINDMTCMKCHPKISERLTSISGIFSEFDKYLAAYKQDVSIFITTEDAGHMRNLEDSATKTGNKIAALLEKVRHAADKMRDEIKQQREKLIRSSRTTIYLTMLLSIAMVTLIFVLVFRGITGPVTSLSEGIRAIASGDFSGRVRVEDTDEIGFMADAFNVMAEKLQAMNFEKDELLGTLRSFNEELERKVAEATESLKAAQDNMVRAETLAAIGTLAAGVSHEISTPLNTIIGFVQLVMSEIEEGSGQKGDLRVVEQEALRCRKIVQSLLTFARTPLNESSFVDINSMLQETLAFIEYQPSMRKVTVRRDLDLNIPAVEADAMQLKQVFLNIILNAVQAMPDGGDLRIATGTSENMVYVLVSDTGSGVPEADRQKIFQPFYTTKKEGTGLGLSISYGIIKEHGGEIFVESGPGGGATFRVSLPVQSAKKPEHPVSGASEVKEWPASL